MVRRPDDDMDTPTGSGGPGVLSVLWSSDAFELDQIAAQLDFPQLARLARDLCDSAGSVLLGRGRLIKLHGLKTFPKVELASAAAQQADAGRSAAATAASERLLLPVGSSETVQVLPFRERDHVYATVGDLIAESPRPRAVVVNKRITLHEKNYTINAGEQLVISSVDKRCTSAGVVDFLICRHHEKVIGLPATCAGHFTAVPDETPCTVKDLGKTCEFPQRVRFGAAAPAAAAATAVTASRQQQQQLVGSGVEYIALGVVRRQYLICTDASEAAAAAGEDFSVGDGGADAAGPSQDRMYFVPLAVGTGGGAPSSSLGKSGGGGVWVHLPQMRDAAVRRVLELCCENLSMRHVVDCTPMAERSASGQAFARTFNEAYEAPLLAPAVAARRPPQQQQPLVGAVAGSSAAGHGLAGYEEPSYAVPGLPRQVNFAARPQSDHGGGTAAHHSQIAGVISASHLSRANSFGARGSAAGTSAPSGGNGGRPDIPKSVSFGGASTAKLPTKRSMRSALGSAVTRLLSPGSSSDEEGPANGRVSSVSASGAATTAASTGDGGSLASARGGGAAAVGAPPKPVGKTRPIMKLPRAHPIDGTVKELWTPPCSPDYRDHTTTVASAAFASLSVGGQPAPAAVSASAGVPQHRSASPPPTSHVAAVRGGVASPDLRTRRRGSCALVSLDSSDCARLSLAQGDCSMPPPPPQPLLRQQQQQTILQSKQLQQRGGIGTSGGCSSSSSRPPSALSVASGASSSSGHGSCADSSTDVSCSPSHDRRSGGHGSSSCHRRSASADSSVGNGVCCSDSGLDIASLADVPEDWSGLSVSSLCACLRLHELHTAAEKLRQQQVDGAFFMMMTEAMFRDQAFGLSDFEVLKIRRLQSGWRPKIK